MDPLTHTLFGASLAETGIARRGTLTTVTLVVAANLPDVDVFSYVGGPDAGLFWRRGWTHGLLALAIWPWLLTAILWLAVRLGARGKPAEFPWARILGLSALGVISHPLLDWFNTYGVRLLMPFSGQWFYGDAIFIVDPWIWLLLGTGLFLGHSRNRRSLSLWLVLAVLTSLLLLGGGEGYPVGKALWLTALFGLLGIRLAKGPLGPKATRRLARFGVAGLAVYAALMTLSSNLAESRVREELAARGFEDVGEVMAGPVPVVSWRRDVVFETAAGYRYGTFDWWRRQLELSPNLLPSLPDSAAVQAARSDPCVRGMVQWMRFPFYEVEDTPDGTDVWLLDARYTRRRTRNFGGVRVQLDEDLRPRAQE